MNPSHKPGREHPINFLPKIRKVKDEHAQRGILHVGIPFPSENRLHRRHRAHEGTGRRERRIHLGLPWRLGPLHLRRAVQARQDSTRARAPRAGRRARRGRVLALDGQGRRVSRHVRPGRDERGDGHRHRLHGFDPARRDQRPGADRGDRPGRVPGVRYRRHHAAVREAQFPREGRARARANRQEGVLHRAHRPARSGPHRHPEGHLEDAVRVRARQERVAALVQPGHERPFGADPQGGVAAAVREASVHLHGRRHHPRRRVARAEPVRRPARLSRHEHADGPRRLSRVGQEIPRHARHARHLRSEHGDAALRRADRDRRASTTA